MAIRVRSSTARGGAVLLSGSAIALLFAVLVFAIRPDFAPMQAWALFFLLLLSAIYVAYQKLAEPEFIVEISAEGLRYSHKYGQWLLSWDNLQFVSPLEIDGKTLNYVGVKLKDIDDFIQNIPLRLAVRLLIEQRPLLITAIRNSCNNGHCPTEYLVEIADFYGKKHHFTGVKAMFGHRMRNLLQLLNFELYIPTDFLDLNAAEFCLIVNQQRLKSLNAKGG